MFIADDFPESDILKLDMYSKHIHSKQRNLSFCAYRRISPGFTRIDHNIHCILVRANGKNPT